MGEDEKIKAARERLLLAIPFFRNAIKHAKAGGQMKLGILSYNPDGSGKIEGAFEADEFFEDIALVVGAPEHTEDDDAKAEAWRFVQRHGLNQ